MFLRHLLAVSMNHTYSKDESHTNCSFDLDIPKNSSVEVTIEYVQELKHDSEVDGVRLTIPTHIAGRYGSPPSKDFFPTRVDDSGISIIVDINMAIGVPIKSILSPTHSVEISLGTLSTSRNGADFSPSNAVSISRLFHSSSHGLDTFRSCYDQKPDRSFPSSFSGMSY
jgi:hypothetical protein